MSENIEDNIENKETDEVEVEKPVEQTEESVEIADKTASDPDDGDYTIDDIKDLNKLIMLKYEEIEILTKLNDMAKFNRGLTRKNISKLRTVEETLDRTREAFTEQYKIERDRVKNNPYVDTANLATEYSFTDAKGKTKTVKDSYLKMPAASGIQNVSGGAAIDAILSMDSNFKRIRLLNSGFFIDVRCPELGGLNALYTTISDSLDEYGFMFGTFFYLFADLEIKRILCDFIKPLVAKSNLKNWDKKDTLLKNISIHDYPAILMSLVSMMYRNGYDMKAVCPKCEYIEESKIDPALLKHHNFFVIANDGEDDNYCLDMIVKTDTVLIADVDKYKSELIDRIFKGKDKIDIDGFEIKLKVPSVFEFTAYGEEFNKNLLKTIYSKEPEAIASFMKYNFFRMLSPWIEYIIKYTDEEKKNGIKVTDVPTISKILDHLQKEKDRANKFADFIIEFIKRSSITHICYPVNGCPNCNKEPSEAVNGFIFLDPQKAFFIMSAMKLTEAL